MRQIHKELGDLINKMAAPQQKDPNPWSILGVSSAATHAEVKKAWRDKSSRAHPDHGGSLAEQKMINLAYELACQLRGWQK